MVQGFLLGVIAAASFTAASYFLRFWRQTRDIFFLAFAASFFVEGCNRVSFLFLNKPNEGSPWIYLIRMFSFLLIVAAILKKNYGKNA